MKILIISDDKLFTDTINSFFQKHNHSTIIYKWLIKAMDNLEEIAPDVIITSADEYPRHWKTLVQFMDSGIAGSDYYIYLYKKDKFSPDESEKIKTLKITGIFSDYSEQSLSETFKEIISNNETKDEVKTISTENKLDNNKKNELVITNPGTHNFVFGNYVMENDKTLCFETKDSCRNIEINSRINKITYQINGKYVSTSANVKQISRQNDITTIILEI